MEKDELLRWVKEELIYGRLNLEELGIPVDEVSDTIPLFSGDGLDLDSVDGLELAVGIEQRFGIKVGKLTEDVARSKFSSPVNIRDYILELQQVQLCAAG